MENTAGCGWARIDAGGEACGARLLTVNAGTVVTWQRLRSTSRARWRPTAAWRHVCVQRAHAQDGLQTKLKLCKEQCPRESAT